MGKFERFREDLLVALVDAAETKPDSYLAPKKVAEAANLLRGQEAGMGQR